MSRPSASTRQRSTALSTTALMSTGPGFSSGSSPCSRDSSMISLTSRLSRDASTRIRSENRCTASGSSAASDTASASRISAPTGVFSSWLTLTVKSRRIASSRRSRVRSSTRTSTNWLPSGATRALTNCVAPSRPRTISRSCWRISPSRRTARTMVRMSSTTSRSPRTMPSTCAGALAWSTWSSGPITTADERSTDRTVATPLGTIGSGDSGILRWARSDSIIAPSESRARAAPMTPPSTAASVGSTATMLRGQPAGKDRMITG